MIRKTFNKLPLQDRRYVLSFLLMMTTLGSIAGNTQAQTGLREVPNSKKISAVFNASFYGIGYAPSDSLSYPNRYNGNFPKTYTFTGQPSDQVDSAVRPLWENMQELKNSQTVIGAPLAKFSEEANIFYAYGPEGGPYASWENLEGIVRVATDIPRELQLISQAHETMHGLQYQNGLTVPGYDRSIYDIQALQLSYEAAAMVGGYLTAIEFLESGKKEYWNSIAEMDTARALQILATYDSLRAVGTPYARALVQTGKIAFCQQLEQQDWLDAYNNTILHNYLVRTYLQQMQPLKNNPAQLHEVRKTGYISATFNFTAAIDSLPGQGRGIFSEDQRLRHAFDCAELWRIEKTSGTQSELYKSMYARLEKQDNPYLALDMGHVLNSYFDIGTLSIITVMEGIKTGKIKGSAPQEPVFGPF